MATALVTGAATGIGRAIARRLARDGFSIVIADLDERRAGVAAGALAEEGHRTLGLAVDVAQEDSVRMMVDQAHGWGTTIDVLVNNAGITGPHLPFVDYPLATIRKVIDVDLMGTIICSQAVLPIMLEQGGGRIVNIASIAGKDGNPRLAPYAAAKAGIIALTKSVAREFAAQGIVVNAVAPGGVGGTEIAAAYAGVRPPDQANQVATNTPMGRLAVPDEIAALVSWLCSDQCSYSTGAVYDISGGRATY